MLRVMAAYYAVRSGRNPGIYRSWAECEGQVNGFPGAKFAKFGTCSEAELFLSRNTSKAAVASSTLDSESEAIPPPSFRKRKLSEDQAPSLESVAGYKQAPFLLRDTGASSSVEEDHIVYTDGACLGNGTASAKAGYGVYWPSRADLTVYGHLPSSSGQTNQRAELTAVLVAIDQIVAHGIRGPVEIRTDSIYAVQGLTNWYKRWEALHWNVDIKNADLFKLLIDTARGRLALGRPNENIIYVRHIRGHSGDAGNDEADRLASLGACAPR